MPHLDTIFIYKYARNGGPSDGFGNILVSHYSNLCTLDSILVTYLVERVVASQSDTDIETRRERSTVLYRVKQQRQLVESATT